MEGFDLKNPVGTNLGYYFCRMRRRGCRRCWAQFDAVKIWSLVAAVLGGCDSGEEVELGQAAAVVVGWWLLIVLIAVAASGGVQLDKGLTPIYTDATDSRARA